MFKPKKPTRPKKVGDTEDVDMDIEGNGSCLTVKMAKNDKIWFLYKNAAKFSLSKYKTFDLNKVFLYALKTIF